jgi:hypothetical protein
MAFIITPPGSTNAPVLTISVVGGPVGDLVISGLTDLNPSNANDVYTFSTLDSSSKHQTPTTATNNVSGNFAIEEVDYEGDAGATADSAAALGLYELSKQKTRIAFTLNVGTITQSGEGYIVGLSPAISADAPSWQSPITIAVDGDYTLA